MALPAPDGKTVFVSVDSDQSGNNGIEVMRRDGLSLQFAGFIPIDGQPAGLALTPDGRTLFVADDDGIAAVSASAAEQGERPTVHYLRARGAGTIEVQSSIDGAYVFFTNERFASVGVALYTGTDAQPWHLVGAVSVDVAPVGMALSPDGNWLYVTSEARPAIARPCYEGMQPHAQGTLRVIDARKAVSDPGSSMAGVTTAGCSPVRVALSPDGATAFVTARGDDAVLAFDTQSLRTDASHAMRATISVDRTPVGIAVLTGGSRAVVADSNRFARSAGAITLIDPSNRKKPVISSLAAGMFPREIRESPQHDVVYVTNYGSQTIEIIPESVIP